MKGITSGEMKPEVSAAASFISNLMGIKSSLSEHQLHLFTQTLSDLLTGVIMQVFIIIINCIHLFILIYHMA